MENELLSEKIKSALDGRTQKWLVEKLKTKGFALMTTVKLCRKLKKIETFSEKELKEIFNILKIKTKNL